MELAPKKKWMVFTKSGEWLGPFWPEELKAMIDEGKISDEDQIANVPPGWRMPLHRHEDSIITQTITVKHVRQQNVLKFPTPAPAPAPAPISVRVDGPTPAPAPAAVADPSPGWKHWMLYAAVGAAAVVVAFPIARFTRSEAPTAASRGLASEPETNTTDMVDRRARELIESGRTKQALRWLRQYHEGQDVRVWSQNAAHRVLYASLLLNEGEQQAQALGLLDQTLRETDPALQAEAHQWLGFHELRDGLGDRGQKHFREALALTKGHWSPAVLFNLGVVFLKAGKQVEARDFFRIAKENGGRNWLVSLSEARTWIDAGGARQGDELVDQAIREDAERWLPYFHKAIGLKRAGDLEGAASALRTMLRHDPAYEPLNPAPFGYYQEPVGYAEYLQVFDSVMRGRPLYAAGSRYLQYLQAGGGKDVRDWPMPEAGGDVVSLLLTLRVYLDLSAPKDRIEAVLAKLPAGADELGAYGLTLRGEAYLKLGQSTEAGDAFSRAVASEPSAVTPKFRQATYLALRGRQEEARKQVNQIRAAQPRYLRAVEWGDAAESR